MAFVSLAAAAVVVALAATATAVAQAVAVAAAAEQQNQNDDPPATVTAPRITAHNHYLQKRFVTAFAVHSMLFPLRQKVRQNSAAARFRAK